MKNKSKAIKLYAAQTKVKAATRKLLKWQPLQLLPAAAAAAKRVATTASALECSNINNSNNNYRTLKIGGLHCSA